jgi:hypothetical protein
MSKFSPAFSRYNVVILDYDGDMWPEKTKEAFVSYVKGGGGVVVYHSSSIAFPSWTEYNEIIGLGAWGDRTETAGPYVYYKGKELITDTTAGPAGYHPARRDFEIRSRAPEHPVMKGLPVRWMHPDDEIYCQLRGPAKNMQILATANSATPGYDKGRDEPMLFTISYGNGRVFHTTLGHADSLAGPAMHCSGFITTFQRGAEWAASGTVTQAVPSDFPTAAAPVIRDAYMSPSLAEAFSNIGFYEVGKSTRSLTEIQAEIRRAAGNTDKMEELEKMMLGVLKSKSATAESKKLILRELSWMGSGSAKPVIESLLEIPELKDEAEFALERMKMN